MSTSRAPACNTTLGLETEDFTDDQINEAIPHLMEIRNIVVGENLQ